MAAKRRSYDWPEDDRLVEMLAAYPTISEAARDLDIPLGTLNRRVSDRGLADKVRAARGVAQVSPSGKAPDADPLDAGVAKLIAKKGATVEGVADTLDVAPGKVRAALERLRDQGYRIPDLDDGGQVISLEPVLPDRLNLHRSLLEGNELAVGVVSDTHLSSNEEALAELELAYDVFADNGITEVWHSGDWTCGYGIFRTQAAEVKNHTFEAQVDYLADHYPRRDGIVTRGISGNHDVEGDFGKIGANPVVALANRRDDIEFLGDYSAWINVATDDDPCWVHLLHGKGGMSYAYSYKAQKLVDGYPAGRKPAVLLPGHWHVSGWIMQRGVNVVWPGCFEWRSPFLARLGLTPAVGFWILRMTVGDDGTLVRFRPEWHQYFEGRVLEAKAA